MITKNFKAIIGLLLLAKDGTVPALIPIKTTSGGSYYLIGYFKSNFPYSVGTSVVFNSTSAGICIGSGNTPVTENDYSLEQIITSGLQSSTPTINVSVDANGNPQLEYTFTLTNTTSSDIVVREIGYAQAVNANTTQSSTSKNTVTCLIDRTVLANPVTIPANGYAAMKYTLKTVMYP